MIEAMARGLPLADTWCAAFVWKKDDSDFSQHLNFMNFLDESETKGTDNNSCEKISDKSGQLYLMADEQNNQ